MAPREVEGTGVPPTGSASRQDADAELSSLAAEAYVFGYPLVLMSVTRDVMSATTPINHFHHLRTFPDHTFTDVVTPNADTLYSMAWLDLTEEPQILTVPALGRRYYIMQMLDAWTNVFASPGTRTTGNGKGDFAIVGPGWRGALPAGIAVIRSPTNLAWMIGRTQTDGAPDYAAVHAIQDQYRLTPLSARTKSYAPVTRPAVRTGVDMKTPPPKQVAAMNGTTFFRRLTALMKDNPPATADAHALARFAKVGLVPGHPFNPERLDPQVGHALEDGVHGGQLEIAGEMKKSRGEPVNGWSTSPAHIGAFATDYALRAAVAARGLGANIPADAIYPHATTDIDGEPLSGTHRYQLRFAKGHLPPVNGFWSLTMYNAKQAFIVNPLNRYAIGDRDELIVNADGSVTIHIQNESPGADKESNWLPAPRESFNVVMRLYWPKKEIVDGSWKVPPIERVP